MQEYVCGFCFDERLQRVVLIEKAQPAWQAGRLNGVGGKVEPGETAADAMAREFEEEAGVLLRARTVDAERRDQDVWTPFCILTLSEGDDADDAGAGEDRVVFYRAVSTDAVHDVRTVESEPIRRIPVRDILQPGEVREQCLPNLRWLIPLAMDPDETVARARTGGAFPDPAA